VQGFCPTRIVEAVFPFFLARVEQAQLDDPQQNWRDIEAKSLAVFLQSWSAATAFPEHSSLVDARTVLDAIKNIRSDAVREKCHKVVLTWVRDLLKDPAPDLTKVHMLCDGWP